MKHCRTTCTDSISTTDSSQSASYSACVSNQVHVNYSKPDSNFLQDASHLLHCYNHNWFSYVFDCKSVLIQLAIHYVFVLW